MHNPAWPDPGYIPTRRAYDNGGYETTSTIARFVPEALDTITAAAIDLLRELFKA